MKTLYITLILFFFACSSSMAFSWQETNTSWNSLGGWKATYSSGSKKLVVNNIKNKGQKIEEYRSGYLIKTKIVIFSGNGAGTWEKYNDLDRCFKQTTNTGNWNLAYNPFLVGMSSEESLRGSFNWGWRENKKTVLKVKYVRVKGKKKPQRKIISKKTINYLSFSRKLNNGMRANTTINGKGYGQSIVVTVKQGKQTAISSKTKISTNVDGFDVPQDRCQN